MNEHPNALLIRQSWLAVAHSDVDTLKELWSPDIVWHVTGENPWKGDHSGVDAVLEYLASVGEMGESYDMTLTDVMAGNEYAALLAHVTTKRAGVAIEVDQVLLARIEKRRIVEAWTLSLDPDLIRKFWT